MANFSCLAGLYHNQFLETKTYDEKHQINNEYIESAHVIVLHRSAQDINVFARYQQPLVLILRSKSMWNCLAVLQTKFQNARYATTFFFYFCLDRIWSWILFGVIMLMLLLIGRRKLEQVKSPRSNFCGEISLVLDAAGLHSEPDHGLDGVLWSS